MHSLRLRPGLSDRPTHMLQRTDSRLAEALRLRESQYCVGRSLCFCFRQLTAILYTLLYLGACYVFTFYFIINYGILFPCAKYDK